MAGWIPAFRGVLGLNAYDDPATLGSDKGGAVELAAAVNGVVTDRKQFDRRLGFTLIEALDDGADSLYACDKGFYFVSGDALCRANATGYEELVTGLTVDERVRYVQVLEDIYWSNGFQKGRLLNGVTPDVWLGSDYAGEREDVSLAMGMWGMAVNAYSELDTVRETISPTILSDPPAGHALALYRGCVFLARDQFVLFTEPWLPCWWCPAEGFLPFDSRVRMVAAVDDGLYVATRENIYFLAGAAPDELVVRHAVRARVIEGTDAPHPDLSRVGDGRLPGPGIIVMTQSGALALGNSGQYFWLTKDKHAPIDADTGSAVVFEGQYLVAIDP